MLQQAREGFTTQAVRLQNGYLILTLSAKFRLAFVLLGKLS